MDGKFHEVFGDAAIMQTMNRHLKTTDIIKISGISQRLREKYLYNPRKPSKYKIASALKLSKRCGKLVRKTYESINPLRFILKRIHKCRAEWDKLESYKNVAVLCSYCQCFNVDMNYGKAYFNYMKSRFKHPMCNTCFHKDKERSRKAMKSGREALLEKVLQRIGPDSENRKFAKEFIDRMGFFHFHTIFDHTMVSDTLVAGTIASMESAIGYVFV